MDIGKLQYPKSSSGYKFGKRKKSGNSSTQYQQPAHNFGTARSPNFKLSKLQDSSLDTNSITNEGNTFNGNDNNNSTSGHAETSSSNAANTPSVPVAFTSNDKVGKVNKPRPNVTSIGSSLRRLITLTFNSGSSSSSSKAQNNSNTSTSNSHNNNTSTDFDLNASRATQTSRSSPSKQRDKSSRKRISSASNSTSRSISASRSLHTILTPNQTSLGSAKPTTVTILERKIPLSHAKLATQVSSDSKRNVSIISDGSNSSASPKSSSYSSSSSNTNNRRQTSSENEEVIKDESAIQSSSSAPTSSPSPASSNATKSSSFKQSSESKGKNWIECPLCVLLVAENSTHNLEGCRHQVCLECMQRYITTEINHSRLNITCPICSEPIHPNTIKQILQNEKYYLKYESFMLRRVLAAEPDARWCPAPDCGYVVLANGCASCPKLVCAREGCNTSFCYHCKQVWHPNQTCSAASIQRKKKDPSPNRRSSKSSQIPEIVQADDIKECPVCASCIIKMNDGSCNHMTCSICETEFCWLCMKEISDLHYFSPSGCTFWGKKPWSRKKKLLWQLGILIGAPVCIILIAGIAVPAIVIGIPVWAARKLHNRLETKQFSRYRKNAILTGGVLLSFLVSPIISAVALAIGIPILLGYVYGVVPLSLCRSSGACLSPANSLENLQQQNQLSRIVNGQQVREEVSIETALSNKFGETSSNMSLETNSIGHVTIVEREDRENASNAGLAGSIISNAAEDGSSTCALAGSIISKESGYTIIPSENLNLNS